MPNSDRRLHTTDDALGILEPGQLTTNRQTPVPRTELSTATAVGLWILRIAVLSLVIMVTYTFIVQLHS